MLAQIISLGVRLISNPTGRLSGDFHIQKVHIKSVWEKNEESLLVVSYFPHFD